MQRHDRPDPECDTIDPEIGGRVFKTKSSEDLAYLSRIVAWAKAARLVRVTGTTLVPVKKNAVLAERPLDLVLALLEACGQVRDWIRSAITRHDCHVDAADAALAVAELYANAVMHGPAGGRVLAGYCLWRDGARIVVCDGGGPGRPRLRESGGLAEGGRGLPVINALAVRWDCFLLAGTQVVWCDFGQPLPAAPGDAWAWPRLVLPACDLSPMAGAPVHTGADDRHAIAGPTTMPDRYPRGYFTECRAAGPAEVREVAVSEPQEGTRAGREFRRADRGARGQP